MNLPHPTRPPRSSRLTVLAACAVPLSLLAGCGPEDTSAFAPACAPVGILAEAADYSDYGGSETQPDLSRLISHGSITAVSGHCSNAAGGTLLHTVISLQMAIDRGPVGGNRILPIPYFIAVTLDGAIVSKQSLVAQAQFPDNGDKVLVKTDPVALDLPLTRTRPGTAYRIEVGFQLSADQLAYNRAHLPR